YTVLDNDAASWQAGMRFYLTSTFSVTADYGESDTDFEPGAGDRSNSGDFWGVGVAWRRPKTGASISLRRSNLEPKEGSEFEGFEGDTWDAEISWSPREKFSLALYSRRNLSYTLDTEESFYVDERFGVRVGLGIGWRFRLNLFSEQGSLDYGEGKSSTSQRSDDLLAWGAELAFPVGQRFHISTGVKRTEVDSEFPGAGYRRNEIIGTFGFGGRGSGARWY
ncbi:MAG: outer membrane beta-barrel protein, partial [Acidobacteria bacterium]|nr:outer membrane beta-barrel protein [Acidobacteriota bacterium]